MPHLVVLYTPNLEPDLDFDALCRAMADAMRAVRDDEGKPVFPTGGTRVLAFPARHFAVADGGAAGQAAGRGGDYAFAWFNLRMGTGRSVAVQQRAGDAIRDCARRFFEPLLPRRLVGVTVQVDESPGQVYDAKFGNLHPLFGRP